MSGEQHFAHRVVRAESFEFPIDLAAFQERVFPDDAYVVLLESLGPTTRLARWSFLVANPFLVFTSKRKQAFAGPPGDVQPLPGDPLDELAALLQRYSAKRDTSNHQGPPFLGGAIGYLGYELLYLLEDIPDAGRDDEPVPDSYLLFSTLVFAFDSHENRTWISATGFGSTPEEAARAADTQLRTARELLELRPAMAPRAPLHELRAEILAKRPRLSEQHLLSMGIEPVLRRNQYLNVVMAAKEHIFAGDIFEVCTCNAYKAQAPASGRDLYRTLSGVSPAPFASYLRFPEVEVISSSPERYMRLDRERWAETRPIKGTRPRGRTTAEDEFNIDDLANCIKDHAENIMIVDLARNDLGRVCSFDTVSVPELRIVETYPLTHQLVSTVRGQLAPERSLMDLIRASFPGGSMTGAPKVEAMKIIDNVEPVKRGIFSGSIGYIDFDGAFDLNIVIRTLIKKGDRLTFHVGGAIVADSQPDDEFQEILDKAHGMVIALEIAAMNR